MDKRANSFRSNVFFFPAFHFLLLLPHSSRHYSFFHSDVINPSNGKVIAQVSEASSKDVDVAVDAAEKAYATWGESVAGHARGKMLMQLADAIEAHADTIASIESQDNGKVRLSLQLSVLLRFPADSDADGWVRPTPFLEDSM